MLNNPFEEIKNREVEEVDLKEPTWLFTKSRIFFLIVVFIVMCIPLIYRHFEYLLK